MSESTRTVTPQTGPDAGNSRSVHEENIISGIKGLIGAGKGDFVDGGKKVSDAVDEAVKGAPGNSADY